MSHPPSSGALIGLDRDAAVGTPEATTARSPVDGQGALDLERQRREVFVGTLAHELRQPLAAMLAAVEVVRLHPGSPVASQAVDVMRRQIGQMNRVVEDLLDAARWAQGKVRLRKQRVDVRLLIAEAAADVAAALAARGQELVVTMTPQALWADVDPQRLHQVLSNLLRNAVKFSEPGGYITLSAQREGTSLLLRVRDTGHGIEPEALTHVFDLFAQLRPSEEGLGVGLSVAREIVALHGGQIQARSEGLGNGSEFVVTLPLVSPPPSNRSDAA